MSEQLPSVLAVELAAGLRTAMGSDLVAVYLYGSSTVGGFVAGVSDLDLLVVLERDLDDAAVAALGAVHAEAIAQHPEWDDRLELVYVGRSTLANFRSGGSLGVVSPGEPFHVRDGVELWISNFYLARETGATVFGPPPVETIPSVSWADFRAEIRRYADEIRSRDMVEATPGGRAYCVLTMCRALATLRDEQAYSKDEAAALVRVAMPAWAWLIDEAARCRLSSGRTGLADAAAIEAARRFVALVRDMIDASAR